MALPLDLTGTTPGNRIVDEVHVTNTLNKRYVLPLKGTFFLKSLKVYNVANGKLLEPLTQYTTLELNIAASTRALDELACMIYVSDSAITSVRLEYQAVGGEYENVSALQSKIQLFINDTSSNVITETVASAAVQVPPQALLGQPHEHNTGATIYQQLSTIAEAIEGGDPAGVQMVYKFLIDYRQQQRNLLTSKLTSIRTQLDTLFDTTEIVQGQYIFTREYMNPKLYLGYGQFVKDSEMLFYSGTATNPGFGDFFNVGGSPGLVATRTLAYRRDDNATPVDFTLTSDKTAVNEGETVTFTLTTSGLPNGTNLPYTVSGIPASDVVEPLTGNFTINSSGIATKTFTVIADEVTDGPKRMTIRLTNIPDILKSVDINDTSTTVAYSSWFSSDMAGNNTVTSVTEGQTVYLQLRATSSVERLYYLLYNNSTSDSSDFTDILADTARFTDTMTIPYNVKADFTTEGNESLVVNLCTANNISSMLISSVLQLADTSKTPTCNTFFATSAVTTAFITQANEGDRVYLHFQTTNLPNGSTLDLTYGGSAVAADFSAALPATVNIVNNAAYISILLVADQVTEGDQNITVAVNHLGLNLANTSLIIKDTSITPAISTKVTSDSAGNTVVNSFNVPGTIYITLTTSGIANGTVATLDFSNSDADVLALLPASTVNVTVYSNKAVYTLTVNDPSSTITQDALLNIQTRINATQYGTTNITVRPRVNATITATFVNTNGVGIVNINEGVPFRLKVTSTNILNTDDALTVVYTDSLTDDDFITARPTTVKITNGIGYIDFTAQADVLQEGSETMTVTVTTSAATGSATSATTMTVLDTSIPAISAKFTSDAAGNTVITQVNEGSTSYLNIITAGYANGSRLDLTYTGSAVSADLLDALPSYVDVVSGKASVAYRWKDDWLTEDDEVITVNIAYSGISLGTYGLTIKDTSKAGVESVYWSAASNGSTTNEYFNEGQTAYLVIKTNGLASGSTLTLAYAANNTLKADDFTTALPITVTSTGATTIVPFTIRNDLRDEGKGYERLNVTVNAVTGNAYSSAMLVSDTSKYALSLNTATSTELVIKPGERYFFVVQGGGGSGGRALQKDKSTWAVGDGDGTRGNTSFMIVSTYGAPPSNMVLNVTALGGGKGRGMVTGGFGVVNLDVDERRIFSEPGGVAWYETNSINMGLTERTNIVTTNGMDGGVHRGYLSTLELIGPGISGNIHSYMSAMDYSTIPNGAVLKSLMSEYGTGGDGGAAYPYSGAGLGGSAGGFAIGIFKNISNQDLKCVIKGGEAVFTNNATTNGGAGMPGGMGFAGYTFITRVDDNFEYAKTVSSWQVVGGPVGVYTDHGNLTGKGYVIDIPPGKRLMATAIGQVGPLPTGGDGDGSVFFYVKQYNGKTYTLPLDGAPFAWTQSFGNVLEWVTDIDSVFTNFELLRVKSTNATANGQPQVVPNIKPLTYNPATVNYQDGIGVTDQYKWMFLDAAKFQGLWQGANFGNATIPLGVLPVIDNYHGHADQGVVNGNYRLQSGSAILVSVVNDKTTNMRVIFGTSDLQYFAGKIIYTLMDA